jgi:hypothetical protein
MRIPIPNSAFLKNTRKVLRRGGLQPFLQPLVFASVGSIGVSGFDEWVGRFLHVRERPVGSSLAHCKTAMPTTSAHMLPSFGRPNYRWPAVCTLQRPCQLPFPTSTLPCALAGLLLPVVPCWVGAFVLKFGATPGPESTVGS